MPEKPKVVRVNPDGTTETQNAENLTDALDKIFPESDLNQSEKEENLSDFSTPDDHFQTIIE